VELVILNKRSSIVCWGFPLKGPSQALSGTNFRPKLKALGERAWEGPFILWTPANQTLALPDTSVKKSTRETPENGGAWASPRERIGSGAIFKAIHEFQSGPNFVYCADFYVHKAISQTDLSNYVLVEIRRNL
jgi:hypothetical protein